MRRLFLSVFLLGVLAGCELEERPSYEAVDNSLPSGGQTVTYAPETGLANIPDVKAELSADHAALFDQSLGWYGTESHFPLQNLHGKTAKQIIDIVNCLKQTADIESQDTCFE